MIGDREEPIEPFDLLIYGTFEKIKWRIKN